jgi:threonine/homoserine/homoserine lactone efflux protein
MATFVFVDLLAYAGAAMGAVVLLIVGASLMRRSTALYGLAALVGEARARECIEQGSFRGRQARAIGVLFILLGTFMAYAVVRGILR